MLRKKLSVITISKTMHGVTRSTWYQAIYFHFSWCISDEDKVIIDNNLFLLMSSKLKSSSGHYPKQYHTLTQWRKVDEKNICNPSPTSLLRKSTSVMINVDPFPSPNWLLGLMHKSIKSNSYFSRSSLLKILEALLIQTPQ